MTDSVFYDNFVLFWFFFTFFLERSKSLHSYVGRDGFSFVAKIPRGIGKLDLRPNKTG